MIFSEGSNNKDDASILQDVKKHAKNVEFGNVNLSMRDNTDKNYTNYLNHLHSTYQTLDLVIGERFHSLVISQMLGIPYIGLSYDSKIDGLAKLSETEEFIVDLVTALDGDDLDEKLLLIFNVIVDNKIIKSSKIKILKHSKSDRDAIKKQILQLM